MKDHQVAQFVNELTQVAKTYGQTQQLRDRISEVVGKTLQVGHRASVLVPGVEELPSHVQAQEAAQRIRETRTQLSLQLREQLHAIRSKDKKYMLRMLDDDDQVCHTDDAKR